MTKIASPCGASGKFTPFSAKESKLKRLAAITLIVCISACLITVKTPQVNAMGIEGVNTCIGIADGVIGLVGLGFQIAGNVEQEEEFRKINEKLEKISKQLEEMQAQLVDIQRTLDQLARNLEINTKEIENYIQNTGAQAGIDSIKTHYYELRDRSKINLKTISREELKKLNEEIQVWSTNIIGTWDIKNAITKIGSAICPDTPSEGVLELWTDQSILKMPGANSPANDFSATVESTTYSASDKSNGDPLPIVVERPEYFNFEGIEDGSDFKGISEPASAWYFAEGTCRPNFYPFICICNPDNKTAKVKISYFLGSGSVVEQFMDVPAKTRMTSNVRDILGEGDDPTHDFSAKVESTNGVNIIAERIQYFRYGDNWDGGSCSSPTTSTSKRAYIAEGTCRPGFECYLTMMNPGRSDTVASLTYLKGDSTTANQQIAVPAHTRVTVRPADILGVGDDAAHDFSTVIESTTNQGLVSELPLYCNYQGKWTGGSCLGTQDSTGAKEWYMAEGTRRQGFDNYILLMNPGTTDTDAVLKYMGDDGSVMEETVAVPAHTRITVKPAELFSTSGSDTLDFSTKVDSSADEGIIVNHSMFFNYGNFSTGGCDGEEAIETPRSKWYFAEGTLRPGFDPYYCIQNPNDEPVNVMLTYMWGDSRTTSEVVNLPAHSRKTVNVRYSPAAKTLINYYQSLESYFGTLLYFQLQGATLIADACNLKYGDSRTMKVSAQTMNYMNGSFQALILRELNEFQKCTESLVASWSYAHQPDGLAPGSGEVLEMADKFCMYYKNALLKGGAGKFKNYYGAFGRVFVHQPDKMENNLHNVMLIGQAGATYDMSAAEQSWDTVRVKYYDKEQQKLLKDEGSLGVVRYHYNCEPGSYLLSVRNGSFATENKNQGRPHPLDPEVWAPYLYKSQEFQIQSPQTETELPFGSSSANYYPHYYSSVSTVGGEGTSEKAPIQIRQERQVFDIKAGSGFCLLLKTGSTPGSGEIKAWGDNTYGHLDVPAGDDFVQVSAGGDFGVALKKDGSIITWGHRMHYADGKDFIQVAAGKAHGLALKKDGSIVGWGDNGSGQTNCPADQSFVQVASGPFSNTSLAVRKDGAAVAWGNNDHGQLSVNTDIMHNVIQVSGGTTTSLLLWVENSPFFLKPWTWR